jgi:sn-glycerol 3-phosphate transport system permease protein
MPTKIVPRVLWNILFVLIAIAMLYPVVFAISNSFKSERDAYNSVLNLFPIGATLANFERVAHSFPLLQLTWNSFAYASCATIIGLFVAFLAGYALVFSALPRWVKTGLLAVIGTALFIPFTAALVPQYLLISRLGLLDTITGLVLLMMFSGQAVILLTQAMRGIPVSLIEMARVDDIAHRHIMRDIVLPLVKPHLIANGIWIFVLNWNNYAIPQLVLRSSSNYTLPLALRELSGTYESNFTTGMAMSVIIMIIPLAIYIFFQRQIISTFSSTGIR